MKKLGFITSEEIPDLIPDDRLAIEPLKTLGFTVEPLVWDLQSRDLDGFDALIFRSCWNYHRKFDRFLEWMGEIRKSGVPVLNSLDVSVWNLNKKYLLELGDKGVSTPRTAWFPKGTSLRSDGVQEKIQSLASDRIVVRPAVSLSGHDTHLVSLQDGWRLREIWLSLPPDRDILVQEFVPEILNAGEISLVFFNGKFSHAVRKTAGENEFRIHSEYGGKCVAISPSPDLVAQAERMVESVGESLLFARVDVVERPHGAALIEIELVDPQLFLGSCEEAPMRFAHAIADKVR